MNIWFGFFLWFLPTFIHKIIKPGYVLVQYSDIAENGTLVRVVKFEWMLQEVWDKRVKIAKKVEQ